MTLPRLAECIALVAVFAAELSQRESAICHVLIHIFDMLSNLQQEMQLGERGQLPAFLA